MATNCSHFDSHIHEKGYSSFDFINEKIVNSKNALKQKCVCFLCPYDGVQLYACLSCCFFGCYSKHMDEHVKQTGHWIAVHINSGFIMCFKCRINIYNENAMERTRSGARYRYQKQLLMYQNLKNAIEESKEYPDRRYVLGHHKIGLRGLLNLGSTCFMNCIIQTFMHLPVLRDYFLAEKHKVCTDVEKEPCILCELFSLYQEFYSGKSESLILSRFLGIVWKNAENMAGYVQHDAHEFFQSIFNIMHKHSVRSEPEEKSFDANCPCITHKIFSGQFQSELICLSCKNVSIKLEHFTEISLNVSGTHQKMITLFDCLEQFTRIEHLTTNCECGAHQDSTKRLTLHKLPLVICFHLKQKAMCLMMELSQWCVRSNETLNLRNQKMLIRLKQSMKNILLAKLTDEALRRFEHSNKLHKKISTPVIFQEELDVSPFSTEYKNLKRQYQDANIKIVNDGPPDSTKYYLTAVVNHKGDLDSGHYTAYVRLKDNWYMCNDEKISKATICDVLQCEGYLLFYHKKTLEYSLVE